MTKWKKFISPSESYEVFYPDDWICETDPEDAKGGTFMFCNKTKQIGILRTTLLTINPKTDASIILKDIKNRNKDATMSKKGENSYLRYTREIMQGAEQLLLLFCYITNSNHLLTVSFTISKEDIKSSQAKKELKMIETILDKIAFI